MSTINNIDPVDEFRHSIERTRRLATERRIEILQALEQAHWRKSELLAANSMNCLLACPEVSQKLGNLSQQAGN